jgi:hypothetical protein
MSRNNTEATTVIRIVKRKCFHIYAAALLHATGAEPGNDKGTGSPDAMGIPVFAKSFERYLAITKPIRIARTVTKNSIPVLPATRSSAIESSFPLVLKGV